MIPLFHIFNSFSFFFCLFAAYWLYRGYKRKKEENLGYFILAFINSALFFALVSIPGIFVNHPFWVQILLSLSWIPLYITLIFTSFILCNIWQVPQLKPLVIILLSFFLTSVIVLSVIYFSPSQMAIYGDFFHWRDRAAAKWVQVYNGVVIGITILLLAIFFFWGGLRTTDPFLRQRAFLISGGITILFIAELLNYAISPLIATDPLTFLASIVALVGLIFMFLGISYKK